MRKKGFRKRFFQSAFFYHEILKSSPIPQCPLGELVQVSRVTLEDFVSRNGNVSPEELLAIASVVRSHSPTKVLEIGTFDGNTTLQIALNTPELAKIHTIDLPEGELQTAEPVLESDLQFICDSEKHCRKFQNHEVAKKIVQHLSDSTTYDFSLFAEDGPLDFIFIDGGHSYECVKSDTKKAREVLSEKGIIMWHDFTPSFGGVYQFLCELSKELPLVHLTGTNLVMFQQSSSILK